MDVSKNRGVSLQIIHFKRVFHYKPSILVYPYFWKHPNGNIFFKIVIDIPLFRLQVYISSLALLHLGLFCIRDVEMVGSRPEMEVGSYIFFIWHVFWMRWLCLFFVVEVQTWIWSHRCHCDCMCAYWCICLFSCSYINLDFPCHPLACPIPAGLLGRSRSRRRK